MDSDPFQKIMKAIQDGPMLSLGSSEIEQPIETESGGGLVKTVTNTKGFIDSIAIDPMLLEKENVHHLEQLLKAAVNDARAEFQKEIGKITAEQMRENLPNQDQVAQMMSDALSKLKPQ